MSDRRRPRFTFRQIFAVPAVLGVLSAIGLVAALVGDGLWDTASWPLLGLPVAVCIWYGWMVRRLRT